jgi:hypothetical protein
MTDAFDEHVNEARDVCRNCFRVRAVERVDPVRGFGDEFEAHYERRKQTTTVDYAPADRVSEHKGVFCECGVESPRHRIWDDGDIDDERFRDLLRAMLETLAFKDVTVRRRRTAAYALQSFRDGAGVDEALATALEVGLATATAATSSTTAD